MSHSPPTQKTSMGESLSYVHSTRPRLARPKLRLRPKARLGGLFLTIKTPPKEGSEPQPAAASPAKDQRPKGPPVSFGPSLGPAAASSSTTSATAPKVPEAPSGGTEFSEGEGGQGGQDPRAPDEVLRGNPGFTPPLGRAVDSNPGPPPAEGHSSTEHCGGPSSISAEEAARLEKEDAEFRAWRQLKTGSI